MCFGTDNVDHESDDSYNYFDDEQYSNDLLYTNNHPPIIQREYIGDKKITWEFIKFNTCNILCINGVVNLITRKFMLSIICYHCVTVLLIFQI